MNPWRRCGSCLSLMLVCGVWGSHVRPIIPECSWESYFYKAALDVIVSDSANIREYYVDGTRLDVVVRDTAILLDVDYLEDFDLPPAGCDPRGEGSAPVPCDRYDHTGLSTFSTSKTPDFRIQFGRIQRSGKGGYLLAATLAPIADGHMLPGGNRDPYDGVLYAFCLDGGAKIMKYKRLHPQG